MAGAPPTIILHVMPGSQFSAKVILALDARNVKHYVQFVDPRPEKRKLPSGGTMVPEMDFNGEIVPDSDDILRLLDKRLGTEFFPAQVPAVAEFCQRASTKLAAYVFYYNWVHEQGYRRSMRSSTLRYVPQYFCCFREMVADSQLSQARKDFRKKACGLLDMDPEDMPSESKMYDLLVEELLVYQAQLKSEQQVYLIPGTSRLTAADAALYCQLERLVGEVGDVGIPCSLPDLITEGRLARLWKWHSEMLARHPIRFKGKRVPEKPAE